MSNLVVDAFTAFAAGAPPASDYPVIESTVTSVNDTLTETHDVTLPTGLTGKLAIIVIRSGRSPSQWYVPSGWTSLYQSGTTGNILIVYRVCNGTEGSTVTFTIHNGSEVATTARMVAIAYRIGGAATSETTFLASDTTLSGEDPPSLTPSWGSAKNLWIALFSARYADWEVTALPSGYASAGAQMQTASLTSSYSSGLVAGQRDAEGASEDPAAFSVTYGTSGISGTRPTTIAVRPAA